jgi:hypothetical protein
MESAHCWQSPACREVRARLEALSPGIANAAGHIGEHGTTRPDEIRCVAPQFSSPFLNIGWWRLKRLNGAIEQARLFIEQAEALETAVASA